MKKKEFDMQQLKKQEELLQQYYSKSQTQIDKDIFNLKYIRYGIKFGSILFRSGAIKSLDRAIKLLEKEKENKVTTESTGWNNPPRFNSMEERDLYYK